MIPEMLHLRFPYRSFNYSYDLLPMLSWAYLVLFQETQVKMFNVLNLKHFQQQNSLSNEYSDVELNHVSSGHNDDLDLIRGLAAVAVDHARSKVCEEFIRKDPMQSKPFT